MSARVFFPVHSARFDVSDAEKFGKPVFLFKTDRPNALDLEACLDAFDSALDSYNYDADEDFIALTGPTIFVVTLVLAACYKDEAIKFLVFDAATSKYVERTLHQ